MPLVYISFDPADEAFLSGLITMPKRRFAHIPVVPAEIDDALFDVISAMEEFHVHRSDFSSYLPILRSLDSLADQVEPILASISLSPGPLPFEPREPVNYASRIVTTMGHVVVFAAGNDGPEERTLSPWSVAPWVIGVGAATKNGDALLPESSVGDPTDSRYRPTVVAPGETVVPLREEGSSAHGTMIGLVLIGKDYAGRNLPDCKDVPFRGTSVAAPKVSRICMFILFILKVFLSVDLYLKRVLGKKGLGNIPAVVSIEKAAADVLGRGGIDDPDFGVLHGVSPAALAPMFAFFARLSVRGAYPAEFNWPATQATPFPTSVMKEMLKSMARPMPGYSPHQVGAGFVDEDLATRYLTTVSSADILRLLFPRVSPSVFDGWHDARKSLFHADIINEVKRRADETVKLSAIKVL